MRLYKHIALINSSAKLNLLARKIYNALLRNAHEQIATCEVITISVELLAAESAYNSNDWHPIAAALRELTTTPVELNILKADHQHWGVTTLLSQAEIMDGTVHYAFSPMMKERLNDQEFFRTIDMRHVIALSSSYAIALYENTCFFASDNDPIGALQAVTDYLPLPTLRHLIGATCESYTDFGRFKDRVLKPAITDINAHTDRFLEILTRTEGRRVTSVAFRVTVQQTPISSASLGRHFFDWLRNEGGLSPRTARIKSREARQLAQPLKT